MERHYNLLFIILLSVTIEDTIANCTESLVLKERRFLDSESWTMAYVKSPFTCPGYIKSWTWLPSVSASFLGLVWRPTGSPSEYEVIGRTMLPAATQINQTQSYDLPTSEWIEVNVGDVIGFKFDEDLLRFDYNESSQIGYSQIITIDDLIVGSRHVLSSTGYRSYPILAVYEEYFDRRSTIIQTKCIRTSTMTKFEQGWKLRQIHVISVVKRPSVIPCAVSCERNTLCLSITYDKKSKLCYLNDNIKTETVGFIDTPGAVYYEFSYEAVKHYEDCNKNFSVSGNVCGAVPRICRCAGNDSRCPMDDWNLIFKAVSGTKNNVYYSYVDGTNAFKSDSAVSLLSLENFRLNEVFENWQSLSINKIKLTLYADNTAAELIHLTFNGVDSNMTSWYKIDNLLDSPWVDLKPGVQLNQFSIPGVMKADGRMRSFYINSYYNRCSGDVGWLVVIEKGITCEWENDNMTPVFKYSLSNNAEKWSSSSFGAAKILTVHVTYG